MRDLIGILNVFNAINCSWAAYEIAIKGDFAGAALPAAIAVCGVIFVILLLI